MVPMKSSRETIREQKLKSDPKPNHSEEEFTEDLEVDGMESLQISAAQADQYLEYLRKKITAHNKDPFSLPFLNLKFEQLNNSWKGATEQLSLESKMYGMRVDNCHETTLKMLNHVIRNQNHVQEVNIENNLHQKQENNTGVQNIEVHLQKPHKISSEIESDKRMLNRSLWQAIFNKCQSLESIQLNNLPLGTDLSLQLDLTQKPHQIETPPHLQDEESLCQRYTFGMQQQLRIFKEIQTQMTELWKDVNSLIGSSDTKKGTAEYEIPQFRQMEMRSQVDSELYFDQEDGEVLEYFGELEDLYHHKEVVGSIVDVGSELDGTQNGETVYFDTNKKQNALELYEIDVIQEDSHRDSEELYEPHQDLMQCCSHFKKKRQSKRRPSKRNANRRVSREPSKLQFDLVVEDKDGCLLKEAEKDPALFNYHLMPPNYVFLFESRNPFKPQKPKMHSIESFHPSQMNNFHGSWGDQNIVPMSQIFDEGQESNPFTQGHLTQFVSQSQQFNTVQNSQIEREAGFNHLNNYKKIPIKRVKQTVKKEIIEEGVMIHERVTSLRLQSEELSQEPSYSFGEANDYISFQSIKSKVSSCDPLDIFLSLLHIAHEDQLMLQPVFQESSQDCLINEADGHQEIEPHKTVKDIRIKYDSV